MRRLSNEMLLESLRKAKELNLDILFIQLLETEVKRRNLHTHNYIKYSIYV